MVRHALPAIFQTREFVAAGGLMSYGGSLADVFRVAGTYAGRVVKGEKPANMPVQQVSKFESSSISAPPRRSASKSRHAARPR